MRVRIWPFVSLSFLVLLLLVPLFAWMVSRKAGQIDGRATRTRAAYSAADNCITSIRANVYRAALLFGDAGGIDMKRARIADLELRTDARMRELDQLLGPTFHDKVAVLRKHLHRYWDSAVRTLDEMDRGERANEAFLRQRSEQRESILSIAERIDALNTANLKIEEQEIHVEQRALWQFSAGATLGLLLLGIGIATGSTIHLARLERISERHRQRSEEAEYELRRLSNQLVSAQEEERKTISRELHDEVGQILTGLRLELGSLWRGEADAGLPDRLDSVKALTEDALRSIRNLSLLLRPSMLDDLGLGAALRWQAKEFSRRTGIPVTTDIPATLTDLPEPFRICLYRVIQEALTNCARHAEAKRVVISLKQVGGLVSASVQDDGCGFDPGNLRTRGLGLVGMEERVRALHGNLSISSEQGSGTTVVVELPFSVEQATEPLLERVEA